MWLGSWGVTAGVARGPAQCRPVVPSVRASGRAAVRLNKSDERRTGVRWTPCQAREDDDPVRGAEARVAGDEHELVVARAAQDAEVARLDDAAARDAVAQGRVGHARRDGVARAQLVDAAEGRAVGRPVPGDRRGAAGAGQRRAVDGAGPAREVREVRAVHDDRAQVQARDRPGGRSPPRPPCGGRSARASTATLRRVPFTRAARREVLRRQRARASRRCRSRARRRWVRCSRSAPSGSCQTSVTAGVGEEEDARGDQEAGEDAAHPPHRRADSVPPSDPGPA